MYFIYKKRSAGFARRALRTSLPPALHPPLPRGGSGDSEAQKSPLAKLRSYPSLPFTLSLIHK